MTYSTCGFFPQSGEPSRSREFRKTRALAPAPRGGRRRRTTAALARDSPVDAGSARAPSPRGDDKARPVDPESG